MPTRQYPVRTGRQRSVIAVCFWQQSPSKHVPRDAHDSCGDANNGPTRWSLALWRWRKRKLANPRNQQKYVTLPVLLAEGLQRRTLAWSGEIAIAGGSPERRKRWTERFNRPAW